MYEIWLALNIVWEIVLDEPAWPVGGAIAALGAWLAAARTRGVAWRRGFVACLPVGLAAAAAAVLIVPRLTGANLSDMSYWIDWMLLLALAAVAAVAVIALLWPSAALALSRARRARLGPTPGARA